MLKIAICDDDDVMLDKMSGKISEEFISSKIAIQTECFTNGPDFIEEHKKSPFDVVFLDIIMPDMNGFEIAEEVRAISENTYIVFVTTEDALVYDSFSFQPFDFIPKFLNQSTDYFETKLKSVIQRLADRLDKIKEISLTQPYGGTLNIICSDIILVKSTGNYVEFGIKNQEPVRVRAKLDDIEKELGQSIFFKAA